MIKFYKRIMSQVECMSRQDFTSLPPYVPCIDKITNAPELLEALENLTYAVSEILDTYDGGINLEHPYEKARAAIKHAGGHLYDNSEEKL